MKRVPLRLVSMPKKPRAKAVPVEQQPKVIRFDFAPKVIERLVLPPQPMNFKPDTSVVWEDPGKIDWPSDQEFLLRTVPEIGPGPFKILEVTGGDTIACQFKIADSSGNPILNDGYKWWPCKFFKLA